MKSGQTGVDGGSVGLGQAACPDGGGERGLRDGLPQAPQGDEGDLDGLEGQAGQERRGGVRQGRDPGALALEAEQVRAAHPRPGQARNRDPEGQRPVAEAGLGQDAALQLRGP